MSIAGYLFSEPSIGPELIKFTVTLGLAFLIALVAWGVSRASNYQAVRRRARQLRSIMLWLAIPGGLYVGARYGGVNFFDLRIFLWLIIIIFVVRLAVWVLGVRRLGFDKVEEAERRRKQGYLRRARRRGRPRKNRRRRH